MTKQCLPEHAIADEVHVLLHADRVIGDFVEHPFHVWREIAGGHATDFGLIQIL